MAAVDGSYKDIGSYKADGGADYRMVPISVPWHLVDLWLPGMGLEGERTTFIQAVTFLGS